MELNTTTSVLRQFSLKQQHRIYTIQKHKFAFWLKLLAMNKLKFEKVCCY